MLRLGPRLLAQMGRWLGRAPADRPTLFLTWANRDGEQRHTQADVVPGAVVRFGLSGAWWGSGDPHAVTQLRKLVAHELAHFWNAEIFRPASWAAPWVSEGNSELLALAALLATGEMAPEQAAQQVSSAFNDCVLMARGRSWTELHHYEKHSGRGPYVCGLAFQFAALAAAAHADRAVDAFEFWRRTWAEHPRYYEAVLQAYFLRSGQRRLADSFGALFTDKSVPVAASLRQVLAAAGLDTQAPADESVAALRAPLMTALMSADCQGNFSFNTFEDRFEIVHGSEILCRTFRKGQVVRRVEGEDMFSRTASAVARANAACRQAGVVRLTADDGGEIRAPCPAAPFADASSLVALPPAAVARILARPAAGA